MGTIRLARRNTPAQRLLQQLKENAKDERRRADNEAFFERAIANPYRASSMRLLRGMNRPRLNHQAADWMMLRHTEGLGAVTASFEALHTHPDFSSQRLDFGSLKRCDSGMGA